MAFYSVRVDDEGKEIETCRQTFRQFESLESSKTVKVSQINASDINKGGINNYKTVRYVNSATFIEKDLKAKKTDPLPEEDEDEEEIGSDCSEYNSDDGLEGQYQTHIATDCDTVPLLEINSNESFPSSNNMTYSYRKVCEVTKMIQKPDAYNEWLDAKRAAKLYEKRVKEEKTRRQEEEKNQRKMLAEKKYQEWMAKKGKRTLEREQQQQKAKETGIAENHSNLESTKKLSEEEQREKEKKFKAWLEKKMQQQKYTKERLNEELKRERELEKRRREEAAAVYNGWLKTAPKKPKPVPLNKGMFTLKGSVSNIYVNPVDWVATDVTESSLSL